MLVKISIRQIPEERQFEYLQLHKKASKIWHELHGFEPKSQEEDLWVRQKLLEYKVLFRAITSFNEQYGEIN